MKGRKRDEKKEEEVKEFSVDKSQDPVEGTEAASAPESNEQKEVVEEEQKVEEEKEPEIVLKDPPPPLDKRGKLALLQKNMVRIGGFAGEEEKARLH